MNYVLVLKVRLDNGEYEDIFEIELEHGVQPLEIIQRFMPEFDGFEDVQKVN